MVQSPNEQKSMNYVREKGLKKKILVKEKGSSMVAVKGFQHVLIPSLWQLIMQSLDGPGKTGMIIFNFIVKCMQ